jgi:hypothetical protein
MTRKELLQRGVDSEYIKEIVIFLDEMIESKFDDEQSFFSDYCYEHDYPSYPYDVHYYITGTTGKALNILVWAERVD